MQRLFMFLFTSHQAKSYDTKSLSSQSQPNVHGAELAKTCWNKAAPAAGWVEAPLPTSSTRPRSPPGCPSDEKALVGRDLCEMATRESRFCRNHWFYFYWLHFQGQKTQLTPPPVSINIWSADFDASNTAERFDSFLLNEASPNNRPTLLSEDRPNLGGVNTSPLLSMNQLASMIEQWQAGADMVPTFSEICKGSGRLHFGIFDRHLPLLILPKQGMMNASHCKIAKRQSLAPRVQLIWQHTRAIADHLQVMTPQSDAHIPHALAAQCCFSSGCAAV